MNNIWIRLEIVCSKNEITVTVSLVSTGYSPVQFPVFFQSIWLDLKALWLTSSQRVAFAITIVACSLFLQYYDAQCITYQAWGWLGKILGMSSTFTDFWKQSEAPQVEDHWDFLWPDEPSSTLRSYTTEKPIGQSDWLIFMSVLYSFVVFQITLWIFFSCDNNIPLIIAFLSTPVHTMPRWELQKHLYIHWGHWSACVGPHNQTVVPYEAHNARVSPGKDGEKEGDLKGRNSAIKQTRDVWWHGSSACRFLVQMCWEGWEKGSVQRRLEAHTEMGRNPFFAHCRP